MIREEAKSLLQAAKIMLMGKDNQPISDLYYALDMAIQALSQEPYICDTCKHKDDSWDTEPCDGCCGNHSGYEPCDAVSRDAVKELIKCGVSTDTYDDVEQVCKWIDALPSVTQKSETVTEFADRCRECGAKYGKLLKQELCEDAVSRQAVNTLVDELARAISDERCFMSRGRSTATIMQDILDLPSVRPQEQTGHWIKLYMSDTGEVKYECSVCGFIASGKWKYCCECGAKMESEG